MQNILVAIGTPAQVCKTRGKSPGWPKGRQRTQRERYDLIRSEQWKRIRAAQKAKKASLKPPRGRPKRFPHPVTA